jgi:hypothetical protein
MSEHTLEHDTPWKEIIETLFPQFMSFFFPEAHAAIDWARTPVFLDKELQQVVRGAATGRHFVDKLVKVWQSGGRLLWKVTLAKMLLESGYKDRQAGHLFRFMDYVLALPEEMELEFDREVIRFAKEGKVTYLSRFERRAMERGAQQGIQQGIQRGMQKGLQQGLKKGLKEGLEQGKTEGEIAAARAAVVDVLESRFNRVPRRLSSQLNKIGDAERLRYLVRQAATTATVKDFERQLTS